MAITRPIVGRNGAMAIDQFDISTANHEFKAKRDAATIDATTFGQRFSYDLAGIQKASIEWKGFYIPGANNYDQVINQRFGQDSDVLAALAPAGWPLFGPVILQPSVITKYDLDAKLKGAVECDVLAMARGAVDDGSILLSPNVPLLTGTNTSTDPNNPNPGGATTSGFAAQLHVITMAGTSPSLAVKLQGSPDGTTWTDLTGGGFTTATTLTAQRITQGIGFSVPAYIRANWTVTGTGGAFTALCGFSRNVTYS